MRKKKTVWFCDREHCLIIREREKERQGEREREGTETLRRWVMGFCALVG